MYKIIAYSYPNNEIRIQKVQSAPLRVVKTCEVTGEMPCELLAPCDHEVWEDAKKNPPPLSLGPNSKTERSTTGYGSLPEKPTSFGLNAKRQLIRSGAAMAESCSTEECLFLTGTLPGSTESAYEAIASYSGYIVNSLKAWISNYVPSKLDFYCWEYQKRGALHLHYCVHVPSSTHRRSIIDGFHSWWIQALSRVGNFARTDLFRKNSRYSHLSDTSKVRAVAEVCRKSPARYLAKYLSKSSTPSRGASRAFTPSRWWGTSRPLKTLLKSMISVVDICEGGYHAICGAWNDVKQFWATNEGVTVSYVHKFGMGETLICYPPSKKDSELFWGELNSMGQANLENLTVNSVTPSKDLRAARDRLMRLLSESLPILSLSFQGLRTSLETYLNMMRAIIPSKSPEPLKTLLKMAADTSSMKSLCLFTPVSSPCVLSAFDTFLDVCEKSIESVYQKGWT